MTDPEIRVRVLAAIQVAPEFDGTGIAVSVDAGVVTLTGRVGSFAEQAAASGVVLRVPSVWAVANEIDVCAGENEACSTT